MENSKKYIGTSEGIEVQNCPYGFTLKTTLFDSMEFNKKKGYRHVTQTRNPKNGRLNNPKKSTYYPLMVRFYDEKGHIKCNSFATDCAENMNRTAKFLFENFNLFSDEEIENVKLNFLAGIKVDVIATVTYKGADLENLKPIYTPIAKLITDSLSTKSKENIFDKITFDLEEIKKTFVEGFDPWSRKTA